MGILAELIISNSVRIFRYCDPLLHPNLAWSEVFYLMISVANLVRASVEEFE